jgi:hypothetical protein
MRTVGCIVAKQKVESRKQKRETQPQMDTDGHGWGRSGDHRPQNTDRAEKQKVESRKLKWAEATPRLPRGYGWATRIPDLAGI